jgi:hypothetical protein
MRTAANYQTRFINVLHSMVVANEKKMNAHIAEPRLLIVRFPTWRGSRRVLLDPYLDNTQECKMTN